MEVMHATMAIMVLSFVKIIIIDNNTTIIIAASILVHWLGVQVQQYVEGK